MTQETHDGQLADLAARVGRRLLAGGLTLTTAESCTGGWVAKCLTDVAGSSSWFHAAAVTYSDAMKTRHLGVSRHTLAEHGAVSEETVREMARGALAFASADLSVALSGIAGPDGGNEEKPVGLVWIAWADPARIVARRYRLDGNREAVRRQSVAAALEGVLSFCDGADRD